jgi:hypothetical protein
MQDPLSIATMGLLSNNPLTIAVDGYTFSVVEEVIYGGGSLIENYNNLSKEKKDIFIKLTVMIKGEEYTQTKKKIKKRKMTVEDIELVVNTVLKEVRVQL